MLRENGDFLVRESNNQMGQFVLSGRHQGRIKHLLLVDPEGVVSVFSLMKNRIHHLTLSRREYNSQDFQITVNFQLKNSDQRIDIFGAPLKRFHYMIQINVYVIAWTCCD